MLYITCFQDLERGKEGETVDERVEIMNKKYMM